MSRLPSSTGSRYKISSPQPLPQETTSSLGSYDLGYPSTSPAQPGYSPAAPYTPSVNSPRLSGEGSKSSTPSGSPARPARSRLREQSGVPSSIAPARPDRRELRPVQTQNLRRPSHTATNEGLPLSPLSPVSAHVENGANGMFNDPFAADRTQRSELRAQTSAQQSATPTQGSEKLRNVVGAFMSASKSQQEAPVRRPGKSEARQRNKQTPKEEIWEVGPEGGGKFAEIDGVLRKIRKDWPFVMDSDFSPSTLALSLLSKTPTATLPAHPGLSTFVKLHETLSGSLQSAVQAHFQSFAASLPAHATFLITLDRAAQQVRTSKNALKEAREGFAGRGKSELAVVRARERMVRDMLKILDTIDQLKQVPDQLESLIGEKSFLQAALILVQSLKTINKQEIAEIGATSELRQYLISQETTLTDILVEELHNHVYLKTFFSDSRWSAHAEGQQDLPVTDAHLADPPPQPSDTTPGSPHSSDHAVAGPGPSSRFSRYLSSLVVKPSQGPVLDSRNAQLGSLSPANRQSLSQTIAPSGSSSSLSAMAGQNEIAHSSNPEADSFTYMETLLEALALLGRLTSALDVVAQRVSTEIHALIENTLDEVEERTEERREAALANPSTMDTEYMSGHSVTKSKALFDTRRAVTALDAMGPPQHAAVLKDLFWTLYSKLAAVLEGYRVHAEVARWIATRRDFKDAGVRKLAADPLLEIWKPVQQEVRALLHAYLTDESQSSALDRSQVISVNEVLREGRVIRDRQKQMFKFADTDTRATSNDIKTYDDGLQQALKASVPGLVGMQAVGDAPQQLSGAATDDRFPGGSRHRTLIPANPFNVTTLFQPTLAFIERATSIAPPGFEEEAGIFSSVLEDFMINVFLPQLDEKVTASFQQAVSGYDAFDLDLDQSAYGSQGPLKSSTRVIALIQSLCIMLQTTPFHKENYSRLVIGVIVQYYQQCSSRFKELASLPSRDINAAEPPLTVPAVWTQREDVIKCLSDLRAIAPADRNKTSSICQREIKLEAELLGDKPMVESQLIHSNRKLESLAKLSQSLRWFIEEMLDLQGVAEEPLSPDDVQPVTAYAFKPSDTPKLPLTRAMAQRYEAIVQTYEQLAEMILNTIRLEVRCRVICNLGAALRTGDYRLESEALEPDPDVLDLNRSLIETEELVSRSLAEDDRIFIFRGLSQLIDHVFVQSARYVKQINAAGVKKIKRNILSLQQILRGISRTPEEGVLSRSSLYWDLYSRGPKDMLEVLRTSKPIYSFEDYNAMLNLQCKADQNDAASSELNTYLIDLHALSMSIDGWEVGDP